MTTRNKSSPEVRDCAVRMVDEHRADYGSEWAAITSIAQRLGERDRVKALESEVKELRRAKVRMRFIPASFRLRGAGDG